MKDEDFEKMLEDLKAKLTVTNVSRMIVKGIASISVGFVASKLIKEYCPTENKKQELQLKVGAYIIGGMAGDAASDWAAARFNEYLDIVKNFFNDDESSETSEEAPTEVPTTE